MTNTAHSFHVLNGSPRLRQRGYIVWSTPECAAVFQSDNKREVIAEAQRRNGFTPVDGSEETYGKQIGM